MSDERAPYGFHHNSVTSVVEAFAKRALCSGWHLRSSTVITKEPNTMSNPYDNASEKMCILGPTLVFKGELTADEDLMLKGRVEGSIRHSSSLRIGEEGSVKGDIKARHVMVEGRIDGDTYAESSVTIKETANVNGNVFSPKVSLVEGARFKGSIDMDYAASGASSPASESGSRSGDGSESAPKTASGAA
jgi:cytoskeletal protein CcmA (bactofilin family)